MLKRVRRPRPIQFAKEVRFKGDRSVVLIDGNERLPIREVVEQWDVRGTWWATERHRRYVTLRTERGTFDVMRDMKTGHWTLVGVYD
ncbi:MAG: hypothetical protein EBR20_07920 [Bacteroidetes bacterium]|jgi:hypothetical protein|nr:hypothetical protein [Bacteroidota bacterium]